MNINEISNQAISDSMTFEEVVTLVENMLEVGADSALDEELLKQPKIFGVLERLYSVHSRKLSILHRQRMAVEAVRERHYGGKMTGEHYKKDPLPEAILKSDIPKKINQDPQVLEIRGLHEEQDRIVTLIEKSKDQLRQRSWDIKNMIDYRKMILGV